MPPPNEANFQLFVKHRMAACSCAGHPSGETKLEMKRPRNCSLPSWTNTTKGGKDNGAIFTQKMHHSQVHVHKMLQCKMHMQCAVCLCTYMRHSRHIYTMTMTRIRTCERDPTVPNQSAPSCHKLGTQHAGRVPYFQVRIETSTSWSNPTCECCISVGPLYKPSCLTQALAKQLSTLGRSRSITLRNLVGSWQTWPMSVVG